ncbi:MAG: Sensory transduction protein LytR [Syntrophorhabdus sp. PtaU1.Bin058]|nr:MAG: Sensory transduction protein LytR [Syntrophorhabdus sp. PtaU1.Bin058]
MNALDYLVKPVDPQRLEESLKRVRHGTEKGEINAVHFAPSDRVFLKTGKKIQFIPLKDIAAIVAEKNYSHIMTIRGKRHIVHSPFNYWERLLPKDVFVALDRSLMINRYHVQSWTAQSRTAELYLMGVQTPFHLGRAAYQRFKALKVTSYRTVNTIIADTGRY